MQRPLYIYIYIYINKKSLTWVSCFLAYAAVRTTDEHTRNLLTYGRLVVSQRHSGPGWLEYDRIFRQHAALSASTVWHETNPSLHASTIPSYRAGPSRVCSICHEPDHTADACAMQVLQPAAPASVLQQPAPHRLQAIPCPGSAQSSAGPTRETRDFGAHMCVMEQGALHLPCLQFQAHLCHMQEVRTQG